LPDLGLSLGRGRGRRDSRGVCLALLLRSDGAALPHGVQNPCASGYDYG
jgi:hypothetical protein